LTCPVTAYRFERFGVLVGDVFQEHLGGFGGEGFGLLFFGGFGVDGVAGDQSRPDYLQRRGRVEGVGGDELADRIGH